MSEHLNDYEQPILKANMFAALGDELKDSGKWVEAVEKYQQSSELFLLALNHTTDTETIQALNILSQNQTEKAHNLIEQLRFFGFHFSPITNQNTQENKTEIENKEQNSQISSNPMLTSVMNPTNGEQSILLESEFLESSSVPSSKPNLTSFCINDYQTNSNQTENMSKNNNSSINFDQNTDHNSKPFMNPNSFGIENPYLNGALEWVSYGVDLIENLLHLLPSTNQTVSTQSQQQEIPLQTTKKDILAASSFISLNQEINSIDSKEIIQKLKEENELLKKMLRTEIEEKQRLIEQLKEKEKSDKENEILKKSIANFREEFGKKAQQFRQQIPNNLNEYSSFLSQSTFSPSNHQSLNFQSFGNPQSPVKSSHILPPFFPVPSSSSTFLQNTYSFGSNPNPNPETFAQKGSNSPTMGQSKNSNSFSIHLRPFSPSQFSSTNTNTNMNTNTNTNMNINTSTNTNINMNTNTNINTNTNMNINTNINMNTNTNTNMNTNTNTNMNINTNINMNTNTNINTNTNMNINTNINTSTNMISPSSSISPRFYTSPLTARKLQFNNFSQNNNNNSSNSFSATISQANQQILQLKNDREINKNSLNTTSAFIENK